MPTFKKNLTEAELQEFREIFDLVDNDRSGQISKDELKKLMITLGLRPTDEQIDAMMAEVDADGSGDIDFPEFVAVMSRRVQAEYTPEQLKASFKIFETDENGYVRTDELEHALMTYGENRLTAEEAAELIAAIDPDNRGKINYIEYINMMSANEF